MIGCCYVVCHEGDFVQRESSSMDRGASQPETVGGEDDSEQGQAGTHHHSVHPEATSSEGTVQCDHRATDHAERHLTKLLPRVAGGSR